MDPFVADGIRDFAEEGMEQKRFGLGLRYAARLAVEQKFFVQGAAGRAMAADHVVGEAVETIGSEAVRGGVMAIAERWLAARV